MDGHQVAQDQGPGQLFVIYVVFEGIGNYGHANGNALVAAAAVGQGRQGASRHAGVGGRRRDTHGVA